MTSPLERADLAVEAAALGIAGAVDAGRGLHAAIVAFERAVEARTRAQVACEIEARIHTWDGMSQQAEAANEVRAQDAIIARTGSKEG